MERETQAMASLLEQGDTDVAYRLWSDQISEFRALREHKEAGAVAVLSKENRQRQKEKYLAMQAGARGVPLPWPSLDNRMRGLWPEELMMLVARTGVGKTWALLVCAIHAWRKGKRVLFVTTELSQETITSRATAVYQKLDYSAFRRGRMAKYQELSFLDWSDTAPESDVTGFYMVGGDFKFNMIALEAAIEDVEPDLLLVDGIYLFEGKGRDRSSRAADNFNQVKMLLKRRKIPGIISTQLNREATKPKDKGGGPKLEHISLSDAGGWNADYAFALTQTKEQKSNKEATILKLKGREVELRDSFTTNWNFEEMDFTESTQSLDDDDFEDEFEEEDDSDSPF